MVWSSAFDLFLLNLDLSINNFKNLNALERCAQKCNKIEELVEKYEIYAPIHKALFGKIKRLKKKFDSV